MRVACSNRVGPSAKTCRIDSRWATTNAVEIRRHAAELAALAPDAILASSSPALAALQQATGTVPIVFVNVIDPVGSGFVDSLTRPSGNTTGFLLFEYSLSGKWLELLKQIAPNVTRAAIFRDTGNPTGNAQYGAIQTVAPSLGIEVSPINMRDASEIERAAAAVIRAEPRPPRDAVHKMATELENYGPPRFQGGVRAIRATLSRKGSTV